MTTRWIALASCLCLGAAAGCGAEQPQDDESVTEGIVATAADGTTTVRYVQVPRTTYQLSVEVKTLMSEGKLAPSDAEAFLRSAGNTSVIDSSCNVNSMWFHEFTNQSGPILCFARTGTSGATAVQGFFYSDGVRASNTGSYWAGSSAGIFHNVGGGGGPQFAAFQRVDMVNFNFDNFPFMDQF